MRILSSIRNHPVRFGAVLATGFGGWLAFDAFKGPNTSPPPPIGEVTRVEKSFPKYLIEEPKSRFRDPSRPGLVTADLLPRLHPGMARSEVEELIGPPPAEFVHPVANVNGRFIYRASYLANLESPQPVQGDATLAPRSMIGVDYDASRPGHPLVKIHIPDPMS